MGATQQAKNYINNLAAVVSLSPHFGTSNQFCHISYLQNSDPTYIKAVLENF